MIQALPSFSNERLKILRLFADERYERELGSGSKEVDDLKIELFKAQLVNMIGESAVNELEAAFADRYDEILIRRCQAHGKFINFHTDVSLRTMQVALNGDDDYLGGRLVFACKGKLYSPKRACGTVTIHENDIVHGVSMFEAGIRYGLFFLKKTLKV